MNAHQKTSGGRTNVRRILVSVSLMLTGLMPGTRLMATDDRASEPSVIVREARGVYSVTARFHVPQPMETALAVLKDYNNIPRFMPNVMKSVVVERGAGGAVVDQEALSHLMMFSKRVYLVLEITEGPDTLRFRDRSGRSFARYEGLWRLCEGNDHTEIHYELTAQPSFDLPEFLLRRLLKRDSMEMIEQLQREIAGRSR